MVGQINKWIPQTVLKYLLCAKHSAGHWGYRDRWHLLSISEDSQPNRAKRHITKSIHDKGCNKGKGAMVSA